MLDPHGFVATCNSTHFFIVRARRGVDVDGRVLPRRDHPRERAAGLRAKPASRRARRTFSLTDVYSADEAFVTGTFAGVVPVHTVDGGTIGDGRRGPMVERLQALYRELVDAATSPARRRAMSDGVRLAMWSGPRNISTALMRSWENRPGHACRRRAALRLLPRPHRPRPSRPRRGHRGDGQTTGGRSSPSSPRRSTGVYYQKHMTHHLHPASCRATGSPR